MLVTAALIFNLFLIMLGSFSSASIFLGIVSGYFLVIKFIKSPSKVFAFFQDRNPTQPKLEMFQA